MQHADSTVSTRAAIEPPKVARTTLGQANSHLNVVWLAGIFLVCFIFFVPFPMGPNENAHVDLTVALVDHGTAAIDSFHTNTVDLAFHHGHYYINKAPGESLLGVPVYLAFKALFHSVPVPPPGVITSAYRSYIVLVFLLSIFTVSIPAVLLLLLFYWFLGFFTRSNINRTILTLALGLGTMMFRYSGTVYSHLPVTALLFAAFVLVWIHDKEEAVRGSRSAWFVQHPHATAGLAGLCLGASVLFEYSSIVITVLIGIYALIRFPRHLWPALIVGGVPGILVVGAYNLAAFGNPLVTGYAVTTSAFPGVHRHGSGLNGAYGHFIPRPKLQALWGMSFSPFRGLFFLSPFLLTAFPGYRLWARRADRDWILFLAVPVAQLLAISTFPGWHGGWAVGPRYLIPMLPFITFPVIFVLDRATDWISRVIVYGLIAISFLAVWIETLGANGYPPNSFKDPLFSYSLVALQHGYLRASVVTLYLFLNPSSTQMSLSNVSMLAAVLFVALVGLWSLLWWSRGGLVTSR